MATLIEELRAQVAQLRAQGQSAVSLDQLDRYLASRAGAGADAKGSLPPDFEVWRHRTGLRHRTMLQTSKETLDAGLAALKAAILINGGAAVAVLAFLGNVVGKENSGAHFSVAGIRWALKIFISGVFCAVVAMAWRYASTFSDSMMQARDAQIDDAREAARPEWRQSLRRWRKFWGVATVGAVFFGWRRSSRSSGAGCRRRGQSGRRALSEASFPMDGRA